MSTRYRKRPVEIEAVQLTDDADWEPIADWCGGRLLNREQGDSGEYETELVIPTLEGNMTAHVDDWVIRVKGEFYPCKPDIFEATYEAVDYRLLPEPSEVWEDIEVWTAGVRYPCSDMGRAWRKFGELKAEGRPDVKIVKRTVVTGPWREVGE